MRRELSPFVCISYDVLVPPSSVQTESKTTNTTVVIRYMVAVSAMVDKDTGHPLAG